MGSSEELLGTHLEFGEHAGNIKGMTWEHIGNNKNSITPPPEKRKKTPLESSHWLHEISICKFVCHHFQLGLIPPLYTKLGYLFLIN